MTPILHWQWWHNHWRTVTVLIVKRSCQIESAPATGGRMVIDRVDTISMDRPTVYIRLRHQPTRILPVVRIIVCTNGYISTTRFLRCVHIASLMNDGVEHLFRRFPLPSLRDACFRFGFPHLQIVSNGCSVDRFLDGNE